MAPHKESHRIPVVINAFRSPSSIWVSELELECDKWDEMSQDRRFLCEIESKIAREVPRKELSSFREPDQWVAVQDRDNEKKWFRGRIIDILQLVNGPQYDVLLIDRGIRARVRPHRLRNLPFKCDELPPQAMNIVLDGVVPVHLGISSSVDAMNPEIALSWTTQADKFVDTIKSTYTKAWFVESENPPAINETIKQTYFGDLLVEVNKRTESLSSLLCEHEYGRRHDQIFGRRVRRECASSMDGGEINHSPSIVSWDSSSSSCAPSPLTPIPLSQSPVSNKPKRTIGDVLKSKPISSPKSVTPEVVNEDLTPTECKGSPQSGPQAKSSKPLSRSELLKKLVEKRTLNQSGDSVSQQKAQESSSGGQTEESTTKPGYVEIPLPEVQRHLDDRFIPAGKLIINEKKPILENFERTKHSRRQNFNPKSADCSSDSSFSDSFKTEPAEPMKSTYLDSVGDSCGSSSDSSSIQPSNNRKHFSSLLSKLHASPTSERNVEESRVSGIQQLKSARSRILSIAKADDSTQAQDYLARSILLHGGFPISPWMTYEQLKSKFSAHVEQLLIDRRWCYSILTLEKFMWPAIQKRQNVIMISPSRTGKTFSYIIPLMDFMIDAEMIPKGNGPLVLILCPGSKAACEVYENCVKVVNGTKKAPRVQAIYGEEISFSTIYKLLNGCEVLVTTPPCFLRIMSHEKYAKSFALNLRRLCHFVIDKADILMTKFLVEMKEIQAILVAEQESRTLKNDDTDPIQIIVASEKWEPHFPSYSKHLRGNPLLCINDCFEACVYGKPEVSFHLTRSKPTKLIQVLKKTAGLNKVVVFCTVDEIQTLEELLRNECLDILVTRPNHNLQQINETLAHWSSSKEGQHYTLLCTDCEFVDLKIDDATCVVHYSFPTEDRSIFVRRLSSILLNLPNIFEEKTRVKSPSIQLILDESNTDQLPVIVQLMHRISKDIPKNLMELAEIVEKDKERTKKINRIFCLNLKMFGECSNTNCQSRHVFVPELDLAEDLPGDGLVKVLVSKVRNAGHLSVRLKEHSRLDGTTVTWPSQYIQISTMMYDYFSKPENRKLIDSNKVTIKGRYAMETIEGLFHRVEIVEVLEKDKFGNPSVVQVNFLEEGEQKNIKVYCLYALPENLKIIPAQCIDVFLCGLLPGDLDDSYDIKATTCVKQLIKFVEDSTEDIFVQGKVVLSMTGSLWLDPVAVCEWLSYTGAKVVHNNIKQTLLEQGYAVSNSNHLPKLFALCGKQLPEPPVQEVSNARKPLPKADWAFLDSENSEEVQFICSETIDNCTLFYVQRTKFQPLLNNLVEEINKDSSKRKEDEVLCLCAGDICLARYEKKWHRAKILSKNETSATVFYVDYGDGGTVTLEEVKSIPSWAITKLPFQAIECSLAAISSVSCDLLYEITNDGERDLYAQVCDQKTAKTTNGKHFLVALFDPVNGSILNKDLLKVEGVEKCEKELKYLDFQIDLSLYNRNDSGTELNPDEYDILNPDDFGFKEDDLSTFPDQYNEDDDEFDMLDGFELNGLEEFMKKDPKLEEMASKALQDVKGGGIIESKLGQSQMQSLPPKDQPCRKPTYNQLKKESNAEDMVHIQDDDDSSDWGEGGNFVGRCRLPVLCNARPPRTKWIEDLYHVWIKISITGVENYFLRWTCDSFQFSTTVGGRIYLINQKLRGTILPTSVKSTLKGFSVEVKLKKALSGVDWGMPFASQRKLPWVTRDMEATADDSSDSDCEISLGTLNKEIRKLPLKMRKKRIPKDLLELQAKPDMDSSGENSNCEHDHVDSDEMF